MRLKTIRTLFTLLSGLLLAGQLMAETIPADEYAGGDGTALNPWQISTLGELRRLSEAYSRYDFGQENVEWAASAHFVVTQDIDASDTEVWNSGEGFEPIGWSNPSQFRGEFDAAGYTISNLFIDRPSEQNVGMFGETRGAKLSNIRLTGCSITGSFPVGGLGGKNVLGAIDNVVTTSCDVTATGGDVGGIAGVLDNGIITASHSSGNITLAAGTCCSGGLVGTIQQQASISNSSSSATVVGLDGVGGLVGFSNSSSSITSSFASGNVTGENKVGGLIGILQNASGDQNLNHASGEVMGKVAVGGLIGSIESNSRITNSYATGDVVGSMDARNTGGLVGVSFGGVIQDSYAIGAVSGSEGVGGLIGYADGGAINRVYATGNISESEFTEPSVSFGVFGGLIGQLSGGDLKASYATGEVNAPDFEHVGGLVGLLSNSGFEMDSNYAKGEVTGYDYVGGLVGDCSNGWAVSNYSMGVATATKIDAINIGALAGKNTNCLQSVLPSYWLDPTGSTLGIGGAAADTSGASGLSLAQMKMQASFVGFNFTNIWQIVEGQTTPFFAIDTFTLTYNSGAGGSIVGTTPQTIDRATDGSAVAAVPDASYRFVGWSDASVANPRTDTNVMGDITVTANFIFVPELIFGNGFEAAQLPQ